MNSCVCTVGYFRKSSQVVNTISDITGSVTGIAVLNDRMYVSYTTTTAAAAAAIPRDSTSTCSQQIAVYCPVTYQFQQNLTCCCNACGNALSDIRSCSCRGGIVHSCFMVDDEFVFGSQRSKAGLQNLVACNINNCLYFVSAEVCRNDNRNDNVICKVALGQENRLSRLSVMRRDPHGLSITNLQNVLVAFRDDSVLFEYSPDGRVVRNISVSLRNKGIRPTQLVHAVQLSVDHIGVTHLGPTHQFLIIDSSGQLVQSYSGYLNEPQGIAVDQQGRIYVADQGSNRILAMDPKTLSAHPLELPADCKLQGPYSICFDTANNRLYIGESNGHRIFRCQL